MTTLKKTMLSNTLLDRFTPLLIDTVINQFFVGLSTFLGRENSPNILNLCFCDKIISINNKVVLIMWLSIISLFGLGHPLLDHKI